MSRGFGGEMLKVAIEIEVDSNSDEIEVDSNSGLVALTQKRQRRQSRVELELCRRNHLKT